MTLSEAFKAVNEGKKVSRKPRTSGADTDGTGGWEVLEEPEGPKSPTNKISLSNTAKNLMRHIDRSIKDTEVALKGRKIREIKLNLNKSEARELATALDIENTPCTLCGAVATVGHFPEACNQCQYALIPEGEAEEVIPFAPGTKITITRLKHWNLSMIEGNE